VVNAAQVSKLRSPAVVAPPQDAVSVSKFRSPAVLAPPQDAISLSKLRIYAVITEKVFVVADYTWPQSVLVPRKAKLSVAPNNISGGQGFTNVEQVIGGTPGRWRLDLSGIKIQSAQERLAWEALEFQLTGRSKTILMPIYRWQKGLVPWPTIGGEVVTSAPGYTVPVILAYSVGLVPAGSTTMTIRVDQGDTLQAGHIFGFNEKVYAITSIDGTDTIGSPPEPTYDVTIWPPIREQIEDVDQLNFDNPTLRCRLDQDLSMAIDGGWDAWKFGSPNLTFWEDVTTPAGGDSP
jgi:hypothetical protein